MSILPNLPDDFKVMSLVTSCLFVYLSEVNYIVQFLVLITTFCYTIYKAKNERNKYLKDKKND